VRKRFLTAALVCVSLSGLLLIPGSALAAAPVTISNALTSSDLAGCDFSAAAAGDNINSGNLASCLVVGNVTIGDPDGGGITVSAAFTATGCTNSVLTLDEDGTGATVDFEAATNMSTCGLTIEGAGSVTEAGSGAITTPALAFDAVGTVSLQGTSNAVSTIAGTADGAFSFRTNDALTVGASGLSDSGGDITIQPGGSVVVAGALSSSTKVWFVNSGAAGATITESSGASITARALSALTRGNITLTNAGNVVGTLAASSYSGGIDFTDDEPSGLELDGIDNGDGSFTITNSGSIENASNIGGSGDDGTLTAQGGSVTESTGTVQADLLTVSGTSVSLLGTDAAETLDATATSGDVDVELYNASTTSLGDISASNGAVSITNNNTGGSFEAVGTITGQSIALTADSFTATSGATLAAPSIALTDWETSDDWAVNASTITPGNSAAIAYSGATSLSIDGGALFNVIPSASTTMTFTGDAPTAGTLDYNAEGGVVTGSDTAPSGTIDNSEYKPISFSGMTAVDVANAGTPPPTPTPTPTTPTPTPTPPTPTPTPTPATTAPPSCTLRVASGRVTLPKRVHGKLKGKATLTLVATCSSAVNVTLGGRITVVSKPAHGKARSKSYTVAAVHVALGAKAARKIVVNMPAAVVKALANKRDKLSAKFTLADPGDAGDVLKSVAISRLT
jgi:hypothetical protein